MLMPEEALDVNKSCKVTILSLNGDKLGLGLCSQLAGAPIVQTRDMGPRGTSRGVYLASTLGSQYGMKIRAARGVTHSVVGDCG